ncbi:MAG: glycoside hydrolase family 140 protein [Bacteroidales bacterium]|nr:glycoside hydrolase family 140 protein [Bacteroidales bacterium]
MKHQLSILVSIALIITVVACTHNPSTDTKQLPALKISDNNRFLTDEHGNPFFWLGDTGWLLFSKLSREETEIYLADRAGKGFNVIQVMVLHTLTATNFYGDSALIGSNVAYPHTTEGNDSEDPEQYDFWDHVDYVVDMAAKKGIYLGMVPVWGSNVKGGLVKREDAAVYAGWLADRYKNSPNIIWLNGGDVRGSDSTGIWNTIGTIINQVDTNHLITFHPFGRTTSSTWFHDEEWLDFNMFQSGHRRYDQDDTEWGFGQDNWKYVYHDYALLPPKPTIDGEPSYEGIPQGLHDTAQPYWTEDDVRRYAYWSVFSGAFGFTYGANSVMQFYKPGDRRPSYGAREYWTEGINLPGAGQMQYLKNLILSRPSLHRVNDQSLIAGVNGTKYEYLVTTRGDDYAFIYTYTGRTFTVQMGLISGKTIKASWYKPADGTTTNIGELENKGVYEFDPPGEPNSGNDWVLVLETQKRYLGYIKSPNR